MYNQHTRSIPGVRISFSLKMSHGYTKCSYHLTRLESRNHIFMEPLRW